MQVRRKLVVIPLVVAAVAGLSAGTYAVGRSVTQNQPEAVTADTTFDVLMSGEQEISATGTPNAGDPDGSGIGSVTVDTATDEVCVTVTFDGIDEPSAMHIHRGVAGVNGPIVVDFGDPTGPFVDNLCVAGGPVADEIAGDPLGFYLNAHNAAYPAGAVRGQLQPLGSETRLLPTPSRVYDSREPNSIGTPALASGSTTVIDLTAGTTGAVPPGAVGALITVTITDTQAAGFLTVYSNALAVAPATSTINWVRTGDDIAVTTTVKVDVNGQIKATLGPNGATDLIIDVLGYLAPETPPAPALPV